MPMTPTHYSTKRMAIEVTEMDRRCSKRGYRSQQTLAINRGGAIVETTGSART
jgi:hypothetical protein